jgi:hypothetical protein
MNRKNLFKALNNLCEEMNCSYNINYGGCCFVAAVIAEQLELHNIPFKIAYTYDPTHYAIKVADRYINRDDFCFKEFYDWSSDYLYNTYYTEDWNDYYSRRWNLIVKTRIKSVFRKYENRRT